MPSSPSPPGSPAVPPYPPGSLVYTFQTPKPGRYQINLAIGDLSTAIANQTISIYDGTTFLATLVNNVSAGADNYIDAQSNVLSAAQWPTFNAPVVFFFQTTQINFVIGDGVNPTYLASIQVQVVLTTEKVSRKVRLARRRSVWRRKIVFPLGYTQPFHTLVKSAARRPFRRSKLRLIKRHLAIPASVFVSARYVAKPRLKPRPQRRRLIRLRRRLYLPVTTHQPLVIPWRPRPKPHIHRKWHSVILKRYPQAMPAVQPSGREAPGSRTIVTVR